MPPSAAVVLTCFILTLLVYLALVIHSYAISDETLLSFLKSVPRPVNVTDPFLRGPNLPEHRAYVEEKILNAVREEIQKHMVVTWWIIGGLAFIVLVLIGRVRGSAFLAQLVAVLIVLITAGAIPDNAEGYRDTRHWLFLRDVVSASAASVMMLTAFILLLFKEPRAHFHRTPSAAIAVGPTPQAQEIGRTNTGGTGAYLLRVLGFVLLGTAAGAGGVFLYVRSRPSAFQQQAEIYFEGVQHVRQSVKRETDFAHELRRRAGTSSPAYELAVARAFGMISGARRELSTLPIPRGKAASDYRDAVKRYLDAESQFMNVLATLPEAPDEGESAHFALTLEARQDALRDLDRMQSAFVDEFRIGK